jgi:hypothetical protein
MATEMFEIKSRVLRGSTVEVHSVRAIEVPADALAQLEEACDDEEDASPDPASLRWYQIEATIFPGSNPTGPMTHWDIDDLILVPADTPDVKGPDDFEAEVDEVPFHRVELIENGEEMEPGMSKFEGPQRLRFTAGFPRVSRDWKFRYYFEQFGRIHLPSATGVG